jgi:RNA polymerase sigma-70 factor (ECF subfamily)
MFMMQATNIQELNKLLFAVSYNMIGERVVCEDIVQDVLTIYYSKQEKNDLDHVQNITAYLVKTTSNRCINYLKKQKKERENYHGVWLPEPILDEWNDIDFQLDINYAFTFLLSQLKPKERAVFILKSAFDFTFKDIGEALDLKEATCRKIFQRLKNKIPEKRKHFKEGNRTKTKLIKAFLAVREKGDLEDLFAVLKEDIILYSDGGGKVVAAKVPLFGAEICGKFLAGIFKKRNQKLSFELGYANQEPALFIKKSETELDSVVLFDFSENQLNRIYIIRNPDKLSTV